MLFKLVQTHLRGAPLPRKDLLRMPGATGELLTAETADLCFKGNICVARLHAKGGGTHSMELIPALYQVTLRNMAVQGMLLTGFERIPERDRTTVEYVQGWWLRAPE